MAGMMSRDRDPGMVVGAGHMEAKHGALASRILPCYAIVYLVAGGGWFRCTGVPTRPVKAGDCLVLFPGLEHGYGPHERGAGPETAGVRYNGRWEHWAECWATFRGGIFNQLEADGLIERKRPVLSPGLDAGLVGACDEIERGFFSGDPRIMPLLVARVHAVLADMVLRDQASRHDQDFTTLACARLSQALDKPLDLDGVARGFGMGVEAFRKAFTAAAGVPPARFRQARRIDRARALLVTTHDPLAGIAAALGYCDQYFFSRQFTQATGVSPARYRREFGGRVKAGEEAVEP